MHKFEMAAFRVKMDASLRYFIDLVTLSMEKRKAKKQQPIRILAGILDLHWIRRASFCN